MTKANDIQAFREAIEAGIPSALPLAPVYDPAVNHAPRRKDILTDAEKRLALRNALRYFEPRHHATLAPEFAQELKEYGRIYMYRFRPTYAMHARPIEEYPARCAQASRRWRSMRQWASPPVATAARASPRLRPTPPAHRPT